MQTITEKTKLERLIQAVADTSFVYGELEHNADECEEAYNATIAAQSELLNYVVNNHRALVNVLKLAQGFCVDARQNWHDWQDHKEIGKLFSIVTSALAAVEAQQ